MGQQILLWYVKVSSALNLMLLFQQAATLRKVERLSVQEQQTSARWV
jgi:hypothetical protein